jgi:hypothetical protein
MDIVPLATSIGSGLVAALITQCVAWVRETRKDKESTKREATYLAIRLAVILERFALDCANGIADQEMYTQSEGHAGAYHHQLPELASYPDEDGWKVMRLDFLTRALELRNEVLLSNRKIASWEDIDRDCIPNECDDQCGRCGYMAWQLACEMRNHYWLSPFVPAWDVPGLLKRNSDSAQETDLKSKARRQSVATGQDSSEQDEVQAKRRM